MLSAVPPIQGGPLFHAVVGVAYHNSPLCSNIILREDILQVQHQDSEIFKAVLQASLLTMHRMPQDAIENGKQRIGNWIPMWPQITALQTLFSGYFVSIFLVQALKTSKQVARLAPCEKFNLLTPWGSVFLQSLSFLHYAVFCCYNLYKNRALWAFYWCIEMGH